MILNPGSHPAPNMYKVMSGLIVPRPIAFVSTISADGVHNVAPFSYFMPICATPPLFAFSVGQSGDGQKHTLANILHSREFVLNIVTENIAEAMNATAANVGPEIDEFQLAGLTAAPSDLITAPRVSESPANFECRLVETREYGILPRSYTMVVGEIVLAHIDDRLLREDGSADPLQLKAVGRLSGSTYCRTTGIFDLERPVA